MNDRLSERLNKIGPRLISDDFLESRGMGNEIGFYIFDYLPEEELKVREHIDFLVPSLPMQRQGLRVAAINLFELLVNHLRDQGLLQKSIGMQQERGSEALQNALKGVLDAQNFARHFASVVKPGTHHVVLIYGVGNAFPLVRTHSLLTNLHALMGRTPLVLFFPGQYDGAALRLFGDSRQGKAHYYRAFRLID